MKGETFTLEFTPPSDEGREDLAEFENGLVADGWQVTPVDLPRLAAGEDGPLEFLRAVLHIEFEKAMDYAQTEEEMLEWTGHIDAVAAANGIVPLWEGEPGVTAQSAGLEAFKE